jgi:hypothetical protein
VDDQIYLVPGEPYFPDDEIDPEPHPRSRRQRALGLTTLLAVVAVAVGIQHSRTSHLQAPVAAPAGPPVTLDTIQHQPWPQGIGVCGAKLDLPQISSDVVAEPTHARLPVAGALPALVDVDTGRRAEIPGLRLRSDQYASTVVRTGAVSYVLVHNCQRRWMASVVRAQAGRPQQVVSSDRTVFGLISDDAGAVWAEAYTGPTKVSPAAALGTTLVRMDRPAPAVELPVSLSVIGISGNQVAAAVIETSPSGPRDRLYRYDLTTRRATLLGTAYSVTESRGKVLWTSAPCSAMGACPLRSIDLHTGRVGRRDFHLPLGSGVTGGVLSPDGHNLAFALQREIPDPYYRSDSPQNPADLVVLDLTTGVLEPVPDLELPPATAPSSISFSPDGAWLLVTLAADGWVDVYSWRSGMARPQLTPRPMTLVWPGITEKQVSPQ